MPEEVPMYSDVEFEAILRDVRECLEAAKMAASKVSLYNLCVKMRKAKFFFQHIVIPAYGSDYERCGRDLLEIADDAALVASRSHFNEVKLSLKRHANEIKKTIKKLEAELQPT